MDSEDEYIEDEQPTEATAAKAPCERLGEPLSPHKHPAVAAEQV